MAKLVIIVALIGLAYWYWFGPHQKSTEALETTQLKENAVIMQRCINEEQRMQATGGLAGVPDVGSSGAEAERVCAARYNLYQRDGNWYKKKD